MKPVAQAIWWWELRRIPYNLVLLLIGLASLSVYYAVVTPLIPPGEDAIEPMLLIFGVAAYGVGANICYTLGWITELFWSGGNPVRTESQRKKIFLTGFVFSSALTTMPMWLAALIWVMNKLTRR